MSPRVKLWLVLSVLVWALVVAFSALYLKKTSASLYEQFRERAEFRAQIFAELASRYLSSEETLQGLLETVFIATDVLYAQVVHQGQTLAAREQGISLPIRPLEMLLQVRETRTPEGEAYWDVTYAFSENQPTAPSYVRLGLALLPLEQELHREWLTVILVVLSVLMLAALLLWGLTGWLTPQEVSVIETSANTTIRLASVEPAPAGSSEILTTDQALVSLERSEERVEPVEERENLQIDDLGKRVFVNGTEIKLSPKEYELLRLLASEPGRVFSNEECLQAVWAGRQWATAQDVKQYVYFLRKKLKDDPEDPQYISTVRGFGYKLNGAVKF